MSDEQKKDDNMRELFLAAFEQSPAGEALKQWLKDFAEKMEQVEKITDLEEQLKQGREALGAELGLKLPVNESESIKYAFDYFKAWFFFCGDSVMDIKANVTRMIKSLSKVRKALQTKKGMRYLEVIRCFDSGMSEKEVAARYINGYASMPDDDEPGGKPEAREKFMVGLRAFESYTGIRRKPKIHRRKRR